MYFNKYLRGNTYCFSALAVFSFSESRESRSTTLQSIDRDLTRDVDTSAAWEGVWPRGAWIMFQRDEILNIPPGIGQPSQPAQPSQLSPAQPSPAQPSPGGPRDSPALIDHRRTDASFQEGANNIIWTKMKQECTVGKEGVIADDFCKFYPSLMYEPFL